MATTKTPKDNPTQVPVSKKANKDNPTQVPLSKKMKPHKDQGTQ
jgi:hypothetical protein